MALLLQIGVNLPRWGLKLFLPDSPPRCKFTPLGFDTAPSPSTNSLHHCVILPRWGLKLGYHRPVESFNIGCKFTPLGFETKCRRRQYMKDCKCKFTPLGFETRRSFYA